MLDTALYIVIYGLAAWQFSLLMHAEDGPWHVFTRLRLLAGLEDNMQGREVTRPGFFADLMNCPYCLSGWLSLLAASWLLYQGVATLPNLLAVWGSIWAIAALLLNKVH